MSLRKKIVRNLSDDLLKKEYLSVENKNKYTGHCYVASETYYHLSNEKLMIYQIKHEGSSHWFLKDEKNNIIDLTSKQFKTKVPYEEATRRSFLTNFPSKRCKTLMKRVLNDN